MIESTTAMAVITSMKASEFFLVIFTEKELISLVLVLENQESTDKYVP